MFLVKLLALASFLGAMMVLSTPPVTAMDHPPIQFNSDSVIPDLIGSCGSVSLIPPGVNILQDCLLGHGGPPPSSDSPPPSDSGSSTS